MAKGRRWGGNDLLTTKAIDCAGKGGSVCWVSQTYRSNSHKRAWRYLTGYARQIGAKVNKVDWSITMPQRLDGGPVGTIVFKSAEYVDSIRGDAYDLVIVDEGAFIDNLRAAIDHVIRPALADRKGELWIFSSPNGYDDFRELWLKGQGKEAEWKSWRFPSWTNPFLDPAEIELARRDCADTTFRQEYGAEFVSRAGAVLADFQRDRHVKRLEYSPNRPVFLSIDPGLVCCAIGIYQVAEETVYKVGEATLRERTYEQAIAIIKGFRSAFPVTVQPSESLVAVSSMGRDWQQNLRSISMDPQSNAREMRDGERCERLWRESFGVPVETSYLPEHRSPEWRAGAIRTRQFSASGQVRDFIDHECVDSIESAEQLCWSNTNRIPEHSPYKHHFDERGYFEVNYFHKAKDSSGQTRNR